MPTLSVRVPDDLARRLKAEERLQHKAHSEMVREALERFLQDLERKRKVAKMVEELKSMSRETKDELKAIQQDFDAIEWDRLAVAEPPPPVYGRRKKGSKR